MDRKMGSLSDRKQSVGAADNKHKKAWARALWLAAFLAVGSPFAAHAAAPAFAPDHILVKPKAGVAETTLQALFARQRAMQHDVLRQLNVRVLHVQADQLETVLRALAHDPNIEFAEKDGIAGINLTPNDPYYTYGYEWHLADISAPQAWDLCTGSSSIVVAVVDSGVMANHPDLVGKVLPGYNFYANNTDTSDAIGHGTGVSGIIAADSNNGTGVAGISWGSLILPIKVTDSTGNAQYSAIASAISYAADHGARVINVSLAGTSSSSTLQSAVDYAWSKNLVIVASAGNAGNNAPEYPAACNHVIGVTALNTDDTLCSWSSYGSYVSLAAPGQGIWTTSTSASSGYASDSGTSFSSPIVAGVAALMASANPQLSNSQIVSILETTAIDLGAAGYDVYFGHGKVNAYEALLGAVGASGGDTSPPTATITAPTAGSTVSGVVTVNVSASDNVGVTKVELYVNGTLAGTDTASSWSFSWDTAGAANGSCTLVAKAYDAAGNCGVSASVSVTVQNGVADTTPPSALITSPVNGATVSAKSQKIYVTATDNVGVTRVDLFIDGKFFASSTSSAPVFSWNTGKVARGAHTLQAFAYDAAGNEGASQVVTVNK